MQEIPISRQKQPTQLLQASSVHKPLSSFVQLFYDLTG